MRKSENNENSHVSAQRPPLFFHNAFP